MELKTTHSYRVEGRLTSGPSSFEKLYSIYENFQNSDPKRILLDFSQVQWMDANLCAVLDSIIFVLNRDFGHLFFINKNQIKGKFDIFQRNGFLKSTDSSEYLIDNHDTSIRMTRFTCDSDGEFYEYIGDQLFGHRAFSEIPNIKSELLEHFLEIFANIQTHAQTKGPVFACGQYYPKNKVLKFTLVDIGVGFFEPIAEFTRGKVKTVDEAILWALAERNSTKPDAPGGLGLTSLKNYCDKKGHIFRIVTNGKC